MSSSFLRGPIGPRLIFRFVLILAGVHFLLRQINLQTLSRFLIPGSGHQTFHPGRLGQRNLERYRALRETAPIGSTSDLDGESLEGGDGTEMFSLMAGRDESACDGWGPEAEARLQESGGDIARLEKWKTCWRANMWHQLQGWEFVRGDGFNSGRDVQNRNKRALARIERCLLLHNTTHSLPTYPPPPSTLTLHSLSNIPPPSTDPDIAAGPQAGVRPSADVWRHADPVELDMPCSLTATKVVLGAWWYFNNGYEDGPMMGEAVWMRSQIQALYEQGYTVLSTIDDGGMRKMHRHMPDVITQIWTEDKIILQCQDDPRCISYDEFQPTDERRNPYRVGSKDEGREVEEERPWAWTKEGLEKIPERERGTIPRHKLFAATYWGTRPHDRHWQTENSGFSFNSLGQEWTLSPFEYPNHTFIPYSIEAACSTLPAPSSESKLDRSFILGKLTKYFTKGGVAVPPSFWPELRKLTGLEAISVAHRDGQLTDPEGVPDGVQTFGKVKSEEFERLVGESKIMIAIGEPKISPSVYSALCQGTPVAIPYYTDVPRLTGWDVFNPQNSQHGPALMLGEPYVYGYRASNTSMLVDVVRRSAENPIPRYIPPKMTHAAELQNMDDLVRYDWARHGRMVSATGHEQTVAQRALVIEHCFELKRCKQSGPVLA